MGGSGDILIIGGLALAVGALIMYPDILANIQLPQFGQPGGEFLPGAEGGGEFIGDGTTGGEFIVEDNPNPTGSCKSQYNGKCGSECKTDRYSARCQECISLCGGGGGQPPGMCFSVGHDRSVPCGTTANSCTGSPGKLYCKCGSNVRGNKIRDDRKFLMGPLRKSCNDCTVYCKTGAAPKAYNPAPAAYPKKISANCTQIDSNTYRWDSSGKSKYGENSCNNARANWLKAYSSSGGSSGGGSTPKPAPKKVLVTRCKCGSGSTKNVNGDCSACKSNCKRTCGLCSPQCLGTLTSVAYVYEEEPYFYDEPRTPETLFANMVVSV